MDGRIGKRKRNADNYAFVAADASDEGEDEDFHMSADNDGRTSANVLEDPDVIAVGTEFVTPMTIQPIPATSSAIGSAIQRNPDGTLVAPKFRKKAKSQKARLRSYRFFLISLNCFRLHSRAGKSNAESRIV